MTSAAFLTILKVILFLVSNVNGLRWFGNWRRLGRRRLLRGCSSVNRTAICYRAIRLFVTSFLNYPYSKISHAVIDLFIILRTHIFVNKVMLVKDRLEFLNNFHFTLGTMEEGQSDLLPSKMTSMDLSQ